MRPPERIDPILRNLDLRNFLESFEDTFDKKTILNCVKTFKGFEDKTRQMWKENPDLRLTQVLVNCDILPNLKGEWYYTEEVDWFVENKILPARDLYFWGNLGKNGKQPLEFIAIKDMETNHLMAVLKTQKDMNKKYRLIMEDELEDRGVDIDLARKNTTTENKGIKKLVKSTDKPDNKKGLAGKKNLKSGLKTIK